MDSDGQHEPGGTWTFTGRDEQLARCRQGLAERAGVLIIGGPGTGRTRLAHEVIARAGDGPWHRLTGADGLQAVAFGAWAHLLPDVGGIRLDDATGWRALADHLRAPDGAIHLLVDDAHWLDTGSAALLHHLVATRQAVAVVTARIDAPKPQALTALWKDGHVLRVDLEPLSPEAVGTILEAALGAPVEPSTVARLHGRTGGSLPLIRELVDAARGAGTLQLLHGAWVETTPTRPSPAVIDLLGDRVDALPGDQRLGIEVLATAAPLRRPVLERLVSTSTVHDLLERGLAVAEGTNGEASVSLTDPILGEVVLERLGAARRPDVLRRVLDQLPAIADLAPADLVRVVAWHLDLGLDVGADHVLQAADQAIAHRDFPTAERLAVAALAAGAGPPASIRLGEALAKQERQLEAEDVLRPLGDRLDELDDPLRCRYAEAREQALGQHLGRLDDAIDVLRSTIATMADDRWRWALEAHLAFRLADCGRLEAARPLAEARLANVSEDEPSALTALVAGCLIRTYDGRCQDTLDLCEAMTPVALRHLDDRPEALGWIVAAQMLATYVKGDFPASLALIEGMEQLFADEDDPTVKAGLLMSHALVLSEQGLLDQALRLIRQSAALHSLDNRRGYQAWCFAIMARIHAMRGELPDAATALAAARRNLWPGGQAFWSDVDVAAIWVAATSGDRAEAGRLLDAALVRAEAEGMATVGLRLRHEAVRAGLPVGPHVAAFATSPVTEQSSWARAEMLHVRALADDDGAGLVEAADALGALGLHLEAAEASAQAAGAYRRVGSSALAARAKQQSAAHQARCESAATPALRFGDLVVGLTDRELDVTTRAAAGQANQEIAEALGISVRTAETHLQRAFAKLGIHRRRDLADLFGQPA